MCLRKKQTKPKATYPNHTVTVNGTSVAGGDIFHRSLMVVTTTIRPGKNSSPTGILVFPSKPYCETRKFFN